MYIAYDDHMVIVSPLPMSVVGGRALTYRWGSVVEITPGEVRETGSVTGPMYAVGAILSVLGTALLLTGTWLWLAFLPVGLLLVGGAWAYRWTQKPGVISAPRLAAERASHHVLIDDADRKLFSDAIDRCQRLTETWPALGALIDVPVAESQLGQALFQLAGVLERRQELRELRGDLAEHDGAFELAPRMAKVGAAVTALDAEVARRVAGLRAVAVATEEFIQDREIRELAEDADEALARLAASDLPSIGVPDAGADLAQHTEAVLKAYRELI